MSGRRCRPWRWPCWSTTSCPRTGTGSRAATAAVTTRSRRVVGGHAAMAAARVTSRYPRERGGSTLDEVGDFYDRYLAAFNARDEAAFAGFFHLPVTIFPLSSAEEGHAGTPPVIVTEM